MFLLYFFTSSILIVFNDSAATYSRLCTSTCTQSSSPIRPFPPSHLYKYSLSTSALWCCAPYIVISFLVFQSSSSSSIFVQLMITASYLTMETALELMPKWYSLHITLSLVYFSLFWCILSLFDLSFLYALHHQPPRFQDTLSFFVNILHHLSIGHTYAFAFNYFSSLHDQHLTLW